MKNNDRKIQLIKAASKRFSKLGYYKTTLEEVARDIRIGKATVYHYFDSKDELYFAVIDWELNDFIDNIKSIFNDESIDILERFVKYFNFKETYLSENKVITNLLSKKFSSELNEKESELISKLFFDEIEIIRLVISFIYREQIEKFDENIPAEIVYLSWMLSISNNKFSNHQNGKKLFNETRIKSLMKIFFP